MGRLVRLATVALAMSVVITAGASAAGKARTPRGQLAHDIVLRWAPHVQEAYGVDPREWAMELVPLFSRVPLARLQAAQRARSFDAMNNALLGQSVTQSPSTTAVGTGSKPRITSRALGDAATDLVFVPVTPCRIIDTRVAGGAIAAGATRSFDITAAASYAAQGGEANDCNGVGSGGDFAAAAINFVAVTPSAGGYITAFPFGATQPLASTLNYTAGAVVANQAIVKLDQGPSTSELSVFTFAQTHLVADIVGYFQAPNQALECVNTSVQTFNLAANSVNFFNNPNCPSGYTAITPYCWTAASGVYQQGSGYNANAAGNSTFCSWQNTTASSQSVFGGNVCCRL